MPLTLCFHKSTKESSQVHAIYQTHVPDPKPSGRSSSGKTPATENERIKYFTVMTVHPLERINDLKYHLLLRGEKCEEGILFRLTSTEVIMELVRERTFRVGIAFTSQFRYRYATT